MIEDALVTILTGAVGGKIVFDQGGPAAGVAPPYVCYAKSTYAPLRSLSGGTGLAKTTYDVTIVAPDSKTLRRLETLINAIATVITQTINGQVVHSVWVNDKNDQYVPPQQQQDRGDRTVTLEVALWHEEAK